MAIVGHQSSLATDLDMLAAALEALELDETAPGVVNWAARRDRLVRSIRSYSIPRLMGPQGPLLVVFTGPTGSGKSTLVNSLSGLEFSETGPLRPTTKGPVVLAGGHHAHSLRRISGIDCEVIAGRAPILANMALIDTPDLDSTSTQNRAEAEILIDNADIVVFVTSALRYADLAPWEILRRASSRGAPVVNVINRLGAGSAGIVTDFRSRLESEGLESAVVRVPEHHVPPDAQRLPGLAVRELQRRILGAVTDLERDRREIVDRVIRSTAAQVLELAEHIDSLLVALDDRRETMEAAMRDAAVAIDLSPLTHDLTPETPPSAPLTRLAWTWRNRMSDEDWAAKSEVIERRLVSLVEADIRRISAARGDDGLAQSIVHDVRSRTSTVAEAWLSDVEALVGPSRLVSGRLNTLVLVDAAVTGDATPSYERYQAGSSLWAQTRRALTSRLESLYEEIGVSLSRGKALPAGPSDVKRLRELAAGVSARSHLVDA